MRENLERIKVKSKQKFFLSWVCSLLLFVICVSGFLPLFPHFSFHQKFWKENGYDHVLLVHCCCRVMLLIALKSMYQSSEKWGFVQVEWKPGLAGAVSEVLVDEEEELAPSEVVQAQSY